MSTEEEEEPMIQREPANSTYDEEDDESPVDSADEEYNGGDGEAEGEEEVLSEESGDDDEEYGEVPSIPLPSYTSDGRYHNKQRCLTLCSRGVTARYRHLLEDLRTLIPHCKRESKLDPGKAGGEFGGGMAKAINDIAEMRSCTTVLFLECRKRMDAYLWVGRTGITAGNIGAGAGAAGGAAPVAAQGPSVKFEITNVHTMDELRLTGNCMKGSRPVLTFDESFDRLDDLRVIKELFVDVFGCPRGHPKSKPFVDRVMGFYYADGKIWVRNYQILEEQPTNAREAREERKNTGSDRQTNLVEIGPRFVLNPIRIFRGSFGGQTLYQNTDYVNPNVIRAQARKMKGRSYEQRKGAERMRKKRREEIVVPVDPLGDVFR